MGLVTFASPGRCDAGPGTVLLLDGADSLAGVELAGVRSPSMSLDRDRQRKDVLTTSRRRAATSDGRAHLSTLNLQVRKGGVSSEK